MSIAVPPPHGQPKVGDLQGVARVAQIITLLGPDTPTVTVSDVTAQLGLNRTTAHRYLTSMAAEGLLLPAQAPATFEPGPLLIRIGAFALAQRQAVLLAPTYLAQLNRTTGATAVLSLWGSLGAVVSAVHEDGGHGTVVTVKVGSQLSLVSAQSVVFLAHLADQLHVDRLCATLPAGDLAVVQQRIEDARARLTSVYDTPGRGTRVMAAPVFDHNGIAATLGVVGTDRMLSSEPGTPEEAKLIDCCRQFTEALGGTWPGTDHDKTTSGRLA